MIWLKRILPLVLIGVGWHLYTMYTENQTIQNEQFAHQYALVTAKVWLATAEYRNDNPGFLRVRDSIFKASGFTMDEFNLYLQENKNQPELYTPYVRLVKIYVDSLSGSPADSTEN
jgi:hypothetical protein